MHSIIRQTSEFLLFFGTHSKVKKEKCKQAMGLGRRMVKCALYTVTVTPTLKYE